VAGQTLELATRLGIGVGIRVDHEVVQVPETPAEVLEALALLEVCGNLGAYCGL
jgi:hypothetical protein